VSRRSAGFGAAGLRLVLTTTALLAIRYASGQPGEGDFAVIAALSCAVFVLDLFDLWLPHGDPIGVDGSLAACALVLVGPIAALLGCTAARAAAHLARHRLSALPELVASVERRTVGLGVAAGAAYGVSLASSQLLGETSDLLLAAAATVGLLWAELLVSQLQAHAALRRSFLSLVGANVRFQLPLLAAQVSVAVLVVITYGQMGAWSLVLMTVLLLLTRQSYAMLLEVRQAYRATIEALVDAAESQSPDREGHAERSAEIARSIASHLAVSSRLMERISYAALLHDIDMIGVDDASRAPEGMRQSGRLLDGVGFLSEVVPILRLCDGEVEAGASCSDEDRLAAFVVALASDVDCREHPSVDSGDAIARVSPFVPSAVKGQAIGAAVTLGYPVPAIQ